MLLRMGIPRMSCLSSVCSTLPAVRFTSMSDYVDYHLISHTLSLDIPHYHLIYHTLSLHHLINLHNIPQVLS